MRRPLRIPALLLVAGLAVGQGAYAACDNYFCLEYAQRDLDNMVQSMGRLPEQYLDVDWMLRFRQKAHDTFLQYLLEQLLDPTHPSISPGLLLPGGMVGDVDYWPTYEAWVKEGRATPVRFRRSTGALIRGTAWRPALDRPGPFPVVSITPGSVQVTEPMYWWAAELLAERGYVVLTFDAQGQGRSETFGHRDDGNESITFDGFPSQQAINFHDLTVEALQFVLSTPGNKLPYRFDGDEAAGYDVFFPYWNAIEYLPDGFANVGLAGHSFGAGGVSFAQDPAHNKLNVDHIRTIVAWDNLSADFTPRVPAMAQTGESFVEPSFHFSRPDPESKKTPFNTWRSAEVDTFLVAPRSATHVEWSFVPILPVSSSSWGNAIGAYYTLAWFDKYLLNDPTADARLLTKAYNTSDPSGERCGDNENCYSIYYKSAYWFHDVGGALHDCDDIAHIAKPAEVCPDTDAS